MDKKINSPTWKIGTLPSNQINSAADIKDNLTFEEKKSKIQRDKK